MLKPFQLGRREWQKRIVRGRLDERSYEVKNSPERCSAKPCLPAEDE